VLDSEKALDLLDLVGLIPTPDPLSFKLTLR